MSPFNYGFTVPRCFAAERLADVVAFLVLLLPDMEVGRPGRVDSSVFVPWQRQRRCDGNSSFACSAGTVLEQDESDVLHEITVTAVTA